MSNQNELISLYDFLGRAAGRELGEKVNNLARQNREKVSTRSISNAKYTGHVFLYRRGFLASIFETKLK